MSLGEPKAKKPVVAAALFFNKIGEILLVKPTYKNHWGMPGGTIEEGESPAKGCVREVKEELSLEVKKENLKLLLVDYIAEGVTKSWGDALRFVFFVGVLSDEEISEIKLQESELERMEFVDVSELPKRLSAHTARAIAKSVEAYKDNKVFYLENGRELKSRNRFLRTSTRNKGV